MSKPDTNQASEEELEFIVSGYRDINGNKFAQVTAKCKCGRGGWVRLEKHPDVQSLIRTEKLKLLAEVRERVVGEPIPDDWDDDIDDMTKWKYYTGYKSNADDFVAGYNRSRAERLEQLTKLEAELWQNNKS